MQQDNKFKPMLSASFKGIEYFKPPYYTSHKLDGVRCILIDGVAYSRKLLPFPNLQLQEKAKELFRLGYNHLDGELINGDPLAKDVFNNSISCVSTINGNIDDLHYYLFDVVSEEPFSVRLQYLDSIKHPFIINVEQVLLTNIDDILKMEDQYISNGGEGLICKHPNSPYKYGRTTLKENYSLKLKRFYDSEAKIVDITPLYSNQNDAIIDDLGHIKRSTKQEGLVIKESMGALLVEDIYSNIQFYLGSGFDSELRNNIWLHKDDYIGKIVKYKYFPVGIKEKPRFPTFLSFVNLSFK